MAEPVGGALSREFRRLYENAGLTQPQVAEHLGLNQSTVSEWARGIALPRVTAFPMIEELCGVPKGTILRRAGYVDDAVVDMVAAIQADPNIVDDTARRILVTLYELSLKPGVRDATDAKVADKRPIANSTS